MGASSPKFFLVLKELIQTHKPDVLFLTGPRVNSRKGIRILRRFSFTRFIVVEAEGFAGGLWCFWNANEVRLEVVRYSSQFITLAVMQSDVVEWLLTLVYASPTDHIRYQL